jgi:hypothetical protein
MRKAVERELEPLYLKKDEAPKDPPPLELPEPVPGGSEDYRRRRARVRHIAGK